MVGALSLDPALREQIYDVVPIEITAVPHLPNEADKWGEVLMKPDDSSTNRFAATGLKPGGAQVYLRTLHDLFV